MLLEHGANLNATDKSVRVEHFTLFDGVAGVVVAVGMTTLSMHSSPVLSCGC